jgi:hypothetical protein
VRTTVVLVRRADPADAATARIDASVVLSSGGEPTAVRERAVGISARVHAPRHRHRAGRNPADANGKIDASKLPAPAVSSPVGRDPAPAAADLTASLTEIWSDVLGVPVAVPTPRPSGQRPRVSVPWTSASGID